MKRDRSGNPITKGVFSYQNMTVILLLKSILLVLKKNRKDIIKMLVASEVWISNLLSWWDRVDTITISRSSPPINTKQKINTTSPENSNTWRVIKTDKIDKGMVNSLHQKVLWRTIRSVTESKSASLNIKKVNS